MAVTAKTLPKERPRRTLQSLGGQDYALPDVMPPSWGQIATITALVLFFILPILVSLTILTIVMVFGSEKVRGRMISFTIPFIMGFVESKTINQRKLLLQHVSGKVLDVGGGAAPYLKIIKGKASHVVIIEPVKQLHGLIRQSAETAGFAHYQITIVEDSLEKYVKTSGMAQSFDWVILGNVLCEVPDVKSALHQIDQILKPGGHVYFCEHCGEPQGTALRNVQECINPWWRCVSGGCNCNRDSLDDIEGMEDWDTISWKITGLIGFVMGLSKKVGHGV